MTTTTDREPSPQEIEREAEASRQRLSSTLDELRENLTPGNVVEEILDNAKDGGASMLRALGNAARENPIPALLIGTGCAMFLMGAGSAGTSTRGPRTVTRRRPEDEDMRGYAPRRRGAMDRMGDEMSDLGGRARETMHDTAQAARDTAESAMDSMSAGVSSARETVAETAAEIRERARRVVEGVSETAQAYSGVALDAARHTGERMAGSVRDTMHRSSERMRENVGTLLHEQPLVLGAIGVAVGAAIGALLPRTQTEDRMLGETSDAVKTSAARLAEEQYEHAKETATKVVEDVREAASERGLTPDRASEVASELGQRAKQAAGLEEPRNDDRPMQQAAGHAARGGGTNPGAGQHGGQQSGGRQGSRQMQGGGGETPAIVEVTPTSTRGGAT